MMKCIATIKGTGTLRSGTGAESPVTYDIDIFKQPSGLKSAHGYIDGDYHSLSDALTARNSTLKRHDTGEEIQVVISRLMYGRPAEIHVSGSPGRH